MSAFALESSPSRASRIGLDVFDRPIAFTIAALVFKIALEVGYWVFVNPVYTYAGFGWSPDIIRYCESWFLYLVLLFITPYRLTKPSDLLLAILLLGLFAPLLSLYGLTYQSRECLYVIITGYLLIVFFRKGRPIRIPLLREGRLLGLIIIGGFVTGVSCWFFLSGGVSFFNLDLTEVYNYRREAGEVINVGLMSYLNIWAYKVFGPALLAIALWRKAYWLAAFVFIVHIFWFGVSTHKSVLFYPFLVLSIWIWFRNTRALSIVPMAITAVVTVTLFLYRTIDILYPASLFIRRVFFVTAANAFDYYEFFSNHPHVWWSNSIVSLGMVHYPYDLNTSDLIGEWQGTGAHVNNTFLANGYMHASVFGVVLYGVIVGLLFRLIDSIAYRGLPVWVALSVIIVPCWSMILNADLPTSLLTHGLGIGIIILFLMRRSLIKHNSYTVRRIYWPAT